MVFALLHLIPDNPALFLRKCEPNEFWVHLIFIFYLRWRVRRRKLRKLLSRWGCCHVLLRLTAQLLLLGVQEQAAVGPEPTFKEPLSPGASCVLPLPSILTPLAVSPQVASWPVKAKEGISTVANLTTERRTKDRLVVIPSMEGAQVTAFYLPMSLWHHTKTFTNLSVFIQRTKLRLYK